jgi:serine protease Do
MSENTPLKKSLSNLPLIPLGVASISIVAIAAIVATHIVPTSAISSQESPIPQLPGGNIDNNFIASAVERTGPAVVRIDSSRAIRSQFSNSSRRVQGTGSGFIINTDGLILTNAHVVAGTDTVRVALKDGRKFTGQVLGADREMDVAVIRINALSQHGKLRSLKTRRMGDRHR